MKKIALLLLALNSFSFASGQIDSTNQFNFLLGAQFNLSNTEINNTTGLGIFVEPNLTINDKIRLGYRFEATALASGVLVLWGGCGGDCKEGANYILNNYIKAEYLLGQPKSLKKGSQFQTYCGLSLNLHTHKRWIITSTDPSEWTDTHKWVANPGLGIRFGALLGKIDISAAYNILGTDFQNYVGFSIGYCF